MSKKSYNYNLLHSFLIACILLSASQLNALNIVRPGDASIIEKQAAKEVRRYIFLRTGTAPELKEADKYASLPDGDVIVVAANASPIITELKAEYGNVDAPSSDDRMGYIIKSISKEDRNILVITGADTYTTLRAAYRFAELLGCHFNLVGDAIPDKKLSYPLDISSYDEKAQPWFELRGCIPFHNFTAGPDIWNTADYVSFITQQAKMGLNFFGLHYYNKSGFPGSQEGPEPHIWIGHKKDVNPDGSVKPEGAYKSYWASSFRHGHEPGPIWGEQPISMSKFTNGTNKLFAHDYFASEAIGSKEPTTPEEMAANFNNVGKLLNTAFTHAKQLGVKTALGTETPMGATAAPLASRVSRNLLDKKPETREEGDGEGGEEDGPEPAYEIFTCPPEVQARMRDVHGFALPAERGEANEKFSKALYEGMFTKIMRSHPLDYFWLWTYECFTYNGGRPTRKQLEAIADDYRYCSEVMKSMKAPFKMATFGWVLGSSGAPYNNGAIDFHDDLPIDVPFGSLSDFAGGVKAVVDAGREGWSSCWYEEDNMLLQPQGRVAGLYNEVAHSIRAGSSAFLAKHWRIHSIAHCSAAHAQLTWDNKVSVSDPMPTMADGFKKFPTFNTFSNRPLKTNPEIFKNWITKFFRDWAKANFGPERSNEIGDLMAKAHQMGESQMIARRWKGSFPRVSQRLPSVVVELWPDEGAPTSETDQKFIDAMHVFTEFCKYKDDIVGAGNRDRYMYWYHWFQSQIELGKLAIFRMHLAHVNEESEDQAAKKALKEKIIKSWSKIMSHETQRIRNESELAVIAQLQRSTWDSIFRGEFGIKEMNITYEGGKAVRAMPEITQIYEGEDFAQKAIFIGNGAITDAKMHYRKMGSKGSFSTAKLATVGNNVLKAKLPNPGYDFEYYVTGAVGGESVVYPAAGGPGADNINKTVIIVKRVDFGKPKPAERVEMTSEVVAGMNKYLMKYYMDWLDKPVDWLNYQTPREACKTEEGKARVAELIRGMGSPTTYGVEVPREAMLLELGLPPLTQSVDGKDFDSFEYIGGAPEFPG